MLDRNNRLTNIANESTVLNFLINIGILFLTIKIVNINLANLDINRRTLEINTRNAHNSSNTVEILKEINNKL